jgi:hypothetical protein
MRRAVNKNGATAYFRNFISTKLHRVTHSSILKMEAARSAETFVSTYQTTLSHILEQRNLRLNTHTNKGFEPGPVCCRLGRGRGAASLTSDWPFPSHEGTDTLSPSP